MLGHQSKPTGLSFHVTARTAARGRHAYTQAEISRDIVTSAGYESSRTFWNIGWLPAALGARILVALGNRLLRVGVQVVEYAKQRLASQSGRRRIKVEEV